MPWAGVVTRRECRESLWEAGNDRELGAGYTQVCSAVKIHQAVGLRL